ncbi:putative isoflavone 2'-hydroxylase [Helianthus anomalus]
MNETLWLYLPTQLVLPHQLSVDCVVGGYHIPRRTIPLINQWVIQYDPKLGSVPERFVGFEGASASASLSSCHLGLGRGFIPDMD